MRLLFLIFIALSVPMDISPTAAASDTQMASLEEGIVYWFTGCTVDYDNDVEWCLA